MITSRLSHWQSSPLIQDSSVHEGSNIPIPVRTLLSFPSRWRARLDFPPFKAESAPCICREEQMQRMSTYFIMRLLGFENYGPWFRTFATGRGNSKFFVQPAPVLITSECGRQGSSGREGAGGKDIGQIGTFIYRNGNDSFIRKNNRSTDFL